ncbi:tyrosine-type recombinase/integrase [Methylorubrum thiocyanatum]|uniref:tyrosine-type recombinase/integrase n=1 Tax=Methylorubrum thiocyanatum TaxID=47958 RepID=UPI00398C7E88
MVIREQAEARKRKTGKVLRRGKWVELRDTSPYWQIVFSLYLNRVSKSSGTTNKREAEKMAAAFRQEMEDQHVRIHGKRGVPMRQRDARLLDAAEWFWKHVGSKDGACGDTRKLLFNIVDIVGRDTLLSEITDERVVECIARLEQYDLFGDPTRGKLTDSRVNTHVKMLRRLMLHAAGTRKFYLPDMPEWPRHTLVFQPRTREANIQELDAITAAWRMDMRPALLFLFESGLRLTNAVELKWSQVDWEKSVITVAVKAPRQVRGRKPRDVEKVRKPREIIITPAIRAILEEQIGKHPEAVFTFTPPVTRRCPWEDRKRLRGQHYPLKADYFDGYWRRIRRKCSIHDLRIHDLRRTRGSWLYRATGDIKLVKEFLHHSDLKTTETTYAHVATEQLVEGVSRMAAYEADLRARFSARTGTPPSDRARSAGCATELDPAKGVSHCRKTRNRPASDIHLGSPMSLEDARTTFRALSLNHRYKTQILDPFGHILAPIKGGKAPGRAGSRTLRDENCRKIAGANSPAKDRTRSSQDDGHAARFLRFCEPYMGDADFLISFVEALDRCFSVGSPPKAVLD